MRMKALCVSAAALAFTAAVIGAPAQAQRMDDCHEHMARAEEHLIHMLHRFGPRNDAVRNARSDLESIRAMCFRHDYGRHNGRGDWRDEHDHTWHGDQRGPHH